MQNCKSLRGGSATLSARVRCSASTTLRYAILEWTGTADTLGYATTSRDPVNDWTSSTYTVGNFFKNTTTTVTATGSTALTANTLTTVSLTGTLGSSANNIIVMFWTDSTQAQNVTLDIGKVQLESGNTANTFTVNSISSETLLCQRYFFRSKVTGATYYTTFGSASSYSTTALFYHFAYQTTMRSNPTISYGGTLAVYDGSFYNVTSLGNIYYGNNGAGVNVNTAGTMTVGHAFSVISNNDSTTYVQADAEI